MGAERTAMPAREVFGHQIIESGIERMTQAVPHGLEEINKTIRAPGLTKREGRL